MFYSGADPVTLLDDLRELGQAHITAHADQVPPLASLEAEHCYLWWEILLVTDRDQAADQGRIRFRRGRMRSAHPAAGRSGRGRGPAWFRAGGGVRTVRGWSAKTTWRELKGTRWPWKNDPASRDNLDSLFRGVHSIKGNAGLLLGHVKGAALTDSHPLQLLLRVAHGLESLLDPFRGVDRRTGVGRDDPNRAGDVRRDPHPVGEPHAQRRGRTGLAGTARASGSPDQRRAERPGRGWARSRVSQHDVTVRRDDRGLFPAPGE